MHLRSELPPARNRSCDQLAEEQLEQGKAGKRSEGLRLSARNVDQECGELEDIERDAERNDNVVREYVEADRCRQKYPVFEIGETAEVEEQSRVEPAPVALDRKLEPIVGEDDERREHAVAQSGGSIEQDAGGQQDPPAPGQQEVCEPDEPQKEREIKGIVSHKRSLLDDRCACRPGPVITFNGAIHNYGDIRRELGPVPCAAARPCVLANTAKTLHSLRRRMASHELLLEIEADRIRDH